MLASTTALLLRSQAAIKAAEQIRNKLKTNLMRTHALAAAMTIGMPARTEIADDFFIDALHEVWAIPVAGRVTAVAPIRLGASRASRASPRADSERLHALPGIGRARSS